MSKRAVSFADELDSDAPYTKRAPIPPDDNEHLDAFQHINTNKPPKKNDSEEEEKEKKHTLDSDEEEEDDHEKMDIKKVEGQEDCSIDFDGNTKMTAFNMKEDMEEGHFDGDGNFIYDKKEKDIKDAWLDDIDWSLVKKKAGDQWEKQTEDDSLPPPVMTDADRKEIFTQLLQLLKPNQTIAKALTELKKQKGMTAAEERKLRWAAKKAGKPMDALNSDNETTKLSELADRLLSDGNMDAYEWSRERVDHMLQKITSVAVDSLDMFADEPVASTSAPATFDDDGATMWEYKDSEDGQVHGPFTSLEMARKQDSNELAAKGLARRIGASSFNPVARIDFDLYC